MLGDACKMPRFPGQIDIIAVGKLRARHWLAAQADYLGRLERYVNVRLVELKDAVGSVPDPVALQREGTALLQAARAARRSVALTPEGTQYDSPALAHWLGEQLAQHGHMALLIGGPLGLAPEVLAGCQEQLALSRLTLPHELARVVLLEQLYRAMTLLSGEKYHK